MTRYKLIAISIVAITIAAVSAFVAVYATGGGDRPSPFDDMTGMMMEGSEMTMQAPEDVMIFFESESEVPAGKQTQVVLKVLDKETHSPVQGADVVIGIERGLPMTTMEMMSDGMFKAEEKGNGVYAFTITPESEGYYTVHTHVIPPGKQMYSMMENHVDFVIIAQ